MKTMTLDEFHGALKEQGVADVVDLAFRCPMCGTIQSAHDLIAAGAGPDLGAVEKYIAFSCVGRWTGAGPHRPGTGSGEGCDWTLGGLFKLHKLEVITSDGERHPRFEPVGSAEAQAHHPKPDRSE